MIEKIRITETADMALKKATEIAKKIAPLTWRASLSATLAATSSALLEQNTLYASQPALVASVPEFAAINHSTDTLAAVPTGLSADHFLATPNCRTHHTMVDVPTGATITIKDAKTGRTLREANTGRLIENRPVKEGEDVIASDPSNDTDEQRRDSRIEVVSGGGTGPVQTAETTCGFGRTYPVRELIRPIASPIPARPIVSPSPSVDTTCKIAALGWITNDFYVKEGTEVEYFVHTTGNCEGYVYIEIFESDPWWSDITATVKLPMTGNQTHGKWQAMWQNDFPGDPEYFIRATVLGSGDVKQSSNDSLLSVSY